MSDDLAAHARISGLSLLTQQLGQARTPMETLRTLVRGLQNVYGPSTSLMISTRGLGDGQYRPVNVHISGNTEGGDFDPWARQGPVHRGGVIADIIKTARPQLVENVDWSGDPFFHEKLAGFDSLVAIPCLGEHLPMNWFFLLRASPERFSTAEFEQAILRTAVINYLLEGQSLAQEVAAAHALVDREVERVGKIQRMLLPNPLPKIPGVEIAASYETFGEAGGDLYDFVPLRDKGCLSDKWAIFIGDASGHGPSAAVVIAIVQALLHAHPECVQSPAELLRHLNRHLCNRPIDSSFVTAFVGIYEPSSRRLVYSAAGHPSPLVLQAPVGEVMRLACAAGYPLGIDTDQEFSDTRLDLERGDTLLMYTDGIEEARNPDDAMFGIEGIEAVVRRGGTPESIINDLRRAVSKHTDCRRATDDQTLVAISIK